jgi:hypothetical protein
MPSATQIVVATNIAETSLTIDDVVFVVSHIVTPICPIRRVVHSRTRFEIICDVLQIDCGKAKETGYDAVNEMSTLQTEVSESISIVIVLRRAWFIDL